jgi:hypothetical protein
MSDEDKIKIIKFEDIVLEDVLKYCNETTWKEGGVAKSRYSLEKGSGINKNIRDADISDIPSSFYKKIDIAIDPHIKQYAKENNIGILKNTAYIVTRYLKGQFFVELTDSTEEFPRKVSAILYLNDNYSGGEISFPHLDISIKPEAGTLITFPGNKHYIHEVKKVTSGTRFTMSMWLRFDEAVGNAYYSAGAEK